MVSRGYPGPAVREGFYNEPWLLRVILPSCFILCFASRAVCVRCYLHVSAGATTWSLVRGFKIDLRVLVLLFVWSCSQRLPGKWFVSVSIVDLLIICSCQPSRSSYPLFDKKWNKNNLNTQKVPLLPFLLSFLVLMTQLLKLLTYKLQLGKKVNIKKNNAYIQRKDSLLRTGQNSCRSCYGNIDDVRVYPPITVVIEDKNTAWWDLTLAKPNHEPVQLNTSTQTFHMFNKIQSTSSGSALKQTRRYSVRKSRWFYTEADFSKLVVTPQTINI